MADQGYLSQLEQNYPESAQRKREAYQEERRRIEALPDGPVELEIPSVEVCKHSISFSNFAYGSGGPSDPVNLLFWNVATSWDVDYDLQNWTDERWEHSCGGTLQVGIWDSAHAGGWDSMNNHDYQLNPESDSTACFSPGVPRTHLRLWGSNVRDSHGEYNYWTVGQAHHDNWGHSCTDDWDVAQGRVVGSFLDGNSNPLWFVGQMWNQWLNNKGTFQCAWSDGVADYIELTQ